MKIASIHLENFKRFKSLDIDVRNGLTKDVASQFLIPALSKPSRRS